MRVLFDCRYVRPDRPDGISRYTAGLVTALARLHPVELLVSDRRQLALLPDAPWHLACAPTSVREPLVARQVRRLRPDVVFSPMQTMGSWGRDYSLVLTLHDLIYYRNRTPPPDLPAPIRLLWRLFHLAWWPQRALLNRADAVVTVSETTAALIAAHRLTTRPVTVVPNAPDPGPDSAPDRPRPPRTGALVYMGSFMPYKNVATLASAMPSLPGHELHLMSRISPDERACERIIGHSACAKRRPSAARASDERARLTALARGGRLVFHDGASDETYREVLSGATALVSASRDEGFGIPLVEAMALGTPVVVSDIPVFREVAADAGTYVDPDDVGGFVRAVRELDDPDVWEQRAAAARKQAANYSWDNSARTLLALLERVIPPRSRVQGKPRS